MAATPPAATTEIAVPAVPNEPSAAILRSERRYHRVEPLGDLQEQFGVAPTLLPPETISTNLLGTPLTLELDTWWRLDLAGPGRIDIVPVEAPLQTRTSRLSIIRPTGWYGDQWLRIGEFFPVGSDPDHPPSELDSWLADHGSLEVLGEGTLTNEVRWIDLKPALTGLVRKQSSRHCPVVVLEYCVPLTLGGMTVSALAEGERLRIYVLDDGPDPVVALGFMPDDPSADFEALDRLVGAVAVGPAGPHPLNRDHLELHQEWPTRSGDRPSTAIPGLTVAVAGGWVYEQRPGLIVSEPSAVARAVLTGDGQPIETVADIRAALDDPRWGLTVTESGTTDMLGTTATILDISGGPSEAVLVSAAQPGDDPVWVSWLTSSHARAWLVETPLGPLIVATLAESPSAIEGRQGLTMRFAAQLRIDCDAATDPCAPDR